MLLTLQLQLQQSQVSKTSRVSRSNGSSGSNSANSNAPRSKKSAARRSGDKQGQAKDEDTADPEGEICIICTNKVGYAGIGPCNHPVCHRCALRQRALYEKEACLVCRSDIERLIITEQIGKNYTDFTPDLIEAHDDKFNIDFTASYAKKDTLRLLEIRCKVCEDSDVFASFKLLSEHVKNEHHKYFCLLCSNNKKSFIRELKLYNFKQLQKHQSEGDEQGFSGHPECKHCRGKRFYSEDELNIHIRDNHERCHICDQTNPKTADYYRNYDALFQHFRSDHFVCNVGICLEKKFVVFREELDLTAHMLKEHGGIASGSKVVIGAIGRQYQSQLSTFSATSLSATSSSNNNHHNEETDSLDTKRMRFEERAKHYLHSDTSKIRSFQKLNAQFRSSKLSASELLKSYQELFSDKDNEDINLLIYELSELFPETSKERRSLLNVSEELVVSSTKERFPMLNSGPGSTSSNVHSWGLIRLQLLLPSERFPALAKKHKQTKPSVSANQPIRYTNVLKNKPTTKIVTNSQPIANYKPTYLNNKNTPVESLPTLGGGSSSSSSSSSLSSLPKTALAKLTTSSTNMSTAKFPALEKATKKKPIPRVNPVVLPSSWGPSLSNGNSNDNLSNDLDFGVPLVIKKKKNGR